ncbi:MAG TPA: lipoyl synthase, partial [Myxococcota bacterium]|nr:lipoyl synthase [Myxococcota bacterium]
MSLKSNESNRLPKDFRKSLLRYEERRSVYQVMRTGGLSTVCEEAKCPNIGECFANKQATFMIMGDRCTRRCHFCAVATKKPLPLDSDEPRKVAQAAKALGLDYVVVTSVDRDELADGGAQHFVNVAQAIKQEIPFAKIEVLVPDFRGKKDAIAMVLNSEIDVFAHNTESVARL